MELSFIQENLQLCVYNTQLPDWFKFKESLAYNLKSRNAQTLIFEDHFAVRQLIVFNTEIFIALE